MFEELSRFADIAIVGVLAWVAFLVLQISVAIRVILKPQREPSSRIAWLVVIFIVPLLGIAAYILLGETNIGRRRVLRTKKVMRRLPDPETVGIPVHFDRAQAVPEAYRHLFATAQSINGFTQSSAHTATLMHNSNTTIDSMVADIDAANDHVHITFYIWLPDTNGLKIVNALQRAASRGVACRALADDLGSRAMIRSKYWTQMRHSGVNVARALPINYPLIGSLIGRIDLRNHRKIVVIDNSITYCGSQNCADPEFLVKAKFAPWVDATVRFVGPIARQNQYLFACDWMREVDENLRPLLEAPVEEGSNLFPRQVFPCQVFPCQVIGTGPTVRYSAMPEMFETLIYSARRELIISTPYYVPDESMQAALCASARRGVRTIIIVPEKNDSRVVAAASRSYYTGLLTAGVEIYEYQGGLLHTKSLTLDQKVALIGSANMDRRSFELNFENNILFCDEALTSTLKQRQCEYIKQSIKITLDDVLQWSWRKRLWNNTIAMFGPVL